MHFFRTVGETAQIRIVKVEKLIIHSDAALLDAWVHVEVAAALYDHLLPAGVAQDEFAVDGGADEPPDYSGILHPLQLCPFHFVLLLAMLAGVHVVEVYSALFVPLLQHEYLRPAKAPCRDHDAVHVRIVQQQVFQVAYHVHVSAGDDMDAVSGFGWFESQAVKELLHAVCFAPECFVGYLQHLGGTAMVAQLLLPAVCLFVFFVRLETVTLQRVEEVKVLYIEWHWVSQLVRTNRRIPAGYRAMCLCRILC